MAGGGRSEADEHGGDLLAAKARFPEAPEPWIDLSTGINPTCYPFDPPPASVYARLPAPGEIRAIEQAAAERYGVRFGIEVVAAAGSQPLIQSLPRLRGQSHVAILGPTYQEHQRWWDALGHRVTVEPSLEAALNGRPDVLVVVNPNNPDGRILPPERLRQAAAALSAGGGWLVVDEAFADLEPGVSLAPQQPDNAILLRSLGKAYGLAGLRVGFALTSPPLGQAMRGLIGPWAVSGPAIAIGRAALADGAWIAGQADVLQKSAAKLDDLLAEAGWAVVGGTRLFRLARHPQAQQGFAHLARHGIWTRQFVDKADVLRFGIPGPQAWDRLRSALKGS